MFKESEREQYLQQNGKINTERRLENQVNTSAKNLLSLILFGKKV